MSCLGGQVLFAFALLLLPRDTAGAQAANQPLRIIQFDVGQGDAALIRTPEGKNILVDAGPASARVVNLLREIGVDTIDLFITSHNHADHIGGAPDVFAAFVVRVYIDNGLPHTTDTFRRTLQAVEAEPELRYLRSTARTIGVGDVTILILPPPRLRNTQNDNSVGVLIRYGRFQALYPGDAQRHELAAWLQFSGVPQVSFLKLSHHGALNGTTADFAMTTRPEVAVISVGRRNRYGHPSPETERIWRAQGTRLYRTDVHGTIVVDVDARGMMTVTTSRPNHSAIQ